MEKYPEIVTERFDNATFHIRYCLKFIKKYLKGNVLEIGAGCGSFTRNYINNNIDSITLTETDHKNVLDLKQNFKNKNRIKILQKKIHEIDGNFDVIMYLHVLEHIKDDNKEIELAFKKSTEYSPNLPP